VWVVDLIEGPYGVWPWYEARADASGRYVSSFFEGREIKVTAMAPGDDGMLRAQSFAQVCARHAIVHGDTTVDVELSPIGLQPSDWRSPVLSGTVFEDTPQGRRALANMGVLYTSYGVDGADVYTRTDAAGRYTFCGLPLGPGSLVAGCNVITSPPTPRPTIIRTEIRGDTVVNIDCP
jgi:hypothetical protein